MMDRLKNLLQLEEGLALKAVKDTVGYVIGYGRNVMTKGISREEASYLLQNDINSVRDECASTIPWYLKLGDAQRGAVEAMVFEMGMGGLLSFKNMLAYLKKGSYTSAAIEILNSTFAHQVPLRANRLSLQIRTNVWQYPPPGARREPRYRGPMESAGVRWTR